MHSALPLFLRAIHAIYETPGALSDGTVGLGFTCFYFFFFFNENVPEGRVSLEAWLRWLATEQQAALAAVLPALLPEVAALATRFAA